MSYLTLTLILADYFGEVTDSAFHRYARSNFSRSTSHFFGTVCSLDTPRVQSGQPLQMKMKPGSLQTVSMMQRSLSRRFAGKKLHQHTFNCRETSWSKRRYLTAPSIARKPCFHLVQRLFVCIVIDFNSAKLKELIVDQKTSTAFVLDHPDAPSGFAHNPDCPSLLDNVTYQFMNLHGTHRTNCSPRMCECMASILSTINARVSLLTVMVVEKGTSDSHRDCSKPCCLEGQWRSV